MKLNNLRNKLRQRRVPIQGNIRLDGILIQKNTSNLGKKYVAKLYRDGKLIASTPANDLSDLDFIFLERHRWK